MMPCGTVNTHVSDSKLLTEEKHNRNKYIMNEKLINTAGTVFDLEPPEEFFACIAELLLSCMTCLWILKSSNKRFHCSVTVLM